MAQILRLTITGEFVTNLARDLWVEGEFEKAMNVLRDMHGLPEAEMPRILAGKRKLVGSTADEDGITLVDDNTDKHCGIKLLTMEQQLYKQKKRADTTDIETAALLAIAAGDVETIASPFGLLKVPSSWVQTMDKTGPITHYIRPLPDEDTPEKSWKRVEAILPVQVDEARQAMKAQAVIEQALRDGAGSKLRQPEVDTADDDVEAPYLDEELTSQCGLITREGKFYGCAFGHHRDLIDALGLSLEHPTYVHVSSRYKNPFMWPAKTHSASSTSLSTGVTNTATRCQQSTNSKRNDHGRT